MAPLAIWCMNLWDKDVEMAVILEVSHTHPSVLVK